MNQNSKREKDDSQELSIERLRKLEVKISRQYKTNRLLSLALVVSLVIGMSNYEWVKSAYAATTAVLMNSTNSTDGMTSLMSSLSGFPSFFVSNSNTSSASTGILGSGSGGATGIKGTSSTGYGVIGTSSSASSGTGVSGVATGGIGVYAKHTSTSVAAPALQAVNLGDGPAIYAQSSDNTAALFETVSSFGGGQIALVSIDSQYRSPYCNSGDIRFEDGNKLLVCFGAGGWKSVVFTNP